MTDALNRRAFLHSLLLGGASLVAPHSGLTQSTGASRLLGRVEAQFEPLQAILRHPPDQSTRLRLTHYRDVIPISGAIRAGPPFPSYAHNDLWYATDGGYIHSSYVIPVREAFNEPEAVIGGGF
jgi:hypothetical protein